MIVVAYGMGDDSTGMLVRAVKRGERPDVILAADPGGELPDTYKFRDMFSDWLVERGFPPIQTVFKVTKDGERLTLEENCFQKKMLPSIVYGYKTCSQKYKIQPQDKFMNNYPPAKAVWDSGGKVTKWIGYNASEPNRATIRDDAKYNYRYPLIEWGMDKAACRAEILGAGLPLPGKSACYFCPNSKPKEIIALSEKHPELMARALAMEKNAELTSLRGLARDYSWQEILDAHNNQMEFPFVTEREMPCGCYDGDSE